MLFSKRPTDPCFLVYLGMPYIFSGELLFFLLSALWLEFFQGFPVCGGERLPLCTLCTFLKVRPPYGCVCKTRIAVLHTRI